MIALPRPRPTVCTRSTVVLSAVMLTLVVSTRWVKFNIEPSVPTGLYTVHTLPPTLERGMLVVLPVPAVMRPWHWRPLLKPVVAVAGDQVCALSVGLWINGEPYGVIYTEAYGKPLPRLRGCFAVPEGHVFVASKAARSIDGRYWGMTRVQDLTMQAFPLWTWR